jgi:hypothetical protein
MLNFFVDEILTHGVLFKAKFLFHIFSLSVVTTMQPWTIFHVLDWLLSWIVPISSHQIFNLFQVFSGPFF